MRLRDLMRHLRVNILRDHSDRVDGVSDDDTQWSDQTLLDFINEGQRRLAREALLLRTEWPNPIATITPRAGVSQYPLDPSVLVVLSARVVGTQRDMVRLGHAEMNYSADVSPVAPIQPEFVGWTPPIVQATPLAAPAVAASYVPSGYMLDETLASSPTGQQTCAVVSLVPIPPTTVGPTPVYPDVALRVAVAPCDLTLDDLDASPAVPVDYHLELLSWAAFRALSLVDHDMGAPDRAAQFKQQFEEMARAARRETMRKMFAGNRWKVGAGNYVR